MFSRALPLSPQNYGTTPSRAACRSRKAVPQSKSLPCGCLGPVSQKDDSHKV